MPVVRATWSFRRLGCLLSVGLIVTLVLAFRFTGKAGFPVLPSASSPSSSTAAASAPRPGDSAEGFSEEEEASFSALEVSGLGPQTEVVPYPELQVGDRAFTNREQEFVDLGEFGLDCSFVRRPIQTDPQNWPGQGSLRTSAAAKVYLNFYSTPVLGRDGRPHISSEGWKPSAKKVAAIEDLPRGLMFEKIFDAGLVSLPEDLQDCLVFVCPAVADEGLVGPCNYLDRVSRDLSLERKADTCALVASSAALVGLGLGEEIDKHRRVFRVNRMPTKAFHRDFGSRMDVLYLNCAMGRRGQATLMGPPKRNCTSTACWKTVACSSGKGPCGQLSAAILRGRCFKDLGAPRKVWGAAPFYVGLHKTTEGAIKESGFKEPTTGFLALWMAIPMCRQVSIYGFAGNLSADGHPQDPKHDLQGEHQMIADLSAMPWASTRVCASPMCGCLKWASARVAVTVRP